jgi:hypothetical protein
MKKIFKPAVTVSCIAILLSVAIYACKKPTDGVDIIISTNTLSKSPNLVLFTNANAASTTIVPASIAVTITGDGASMVQTDDGGKVYTALNGIMPLSLTRTSKPTPATPVVYTISVNPTGFLPVTQTITVTSDTAKLITTIPLVELAKPPVGISSLVKTTALVAGTSDAAVLTIPSAANAPDAVSIAIPAGTKMLDKNGAAINATTLKSSLVYFDAASTGANNSFPGGFNPTTVTGQGGKALTGKVTFITAGFVSINVLAGTTQVKSFSKPVVINMEINSALINPLTGVLVKAGDVIPLFSLNEDTGAWTYEGTTTVTKNTNGKLALQYSITHLSGWGNNWFSEACAAALNFTVHIPGVTGSFTDYVVFISSANDQYLGGMFSDQSWSHTTALSDNFKSLIPSLPASLGNIKLVVYSRKGDPTSKVGETELFAACGKGSIDITIKPPVAVDYVGAAINCVAKCTSKQIVANPTTWMYLKDVTAGSTNFVYMINGVVNTKLIVGHTYSMSTTYSSKTFTSGEFKAQKADFPINSTTGLSGTATYGASNNTLIVNGLFTINKCG